MMKKYNELKEDSEAYTLAQQREEWEVRYRSELLGAEMLGKTKGKAEGRAEGISQGISQGKKLICIKAVDKKYLVNSQEWVKTLTESQLDRVFDIIYDEDDYQVFQEKIESLSS